MVVTGHFVRERVLGGLWAAVWMWPLVNPIVAVAQGKVAHGGWAATGLTAFIALYLVIVTNGFDDQRPRATRVDIAMLLILAAIGMTLLMIYGHKPDGWPNLAIYTAVAGASILGPALTASWVLSICGITISWALTAPHPPHEQIAADLGSIIFATLLASGLVHTIKQMIRYIRQLRDTRASLARTAVDEERLRFARDLHDLLGHTISTIVVKAEVVRRLVDRDPTLAAEAAADIEAIGRRALADVRKTVDGYRSPGFEAELATVRPALADAGIEVRYRHYGPTLPAPAAAAFGWVVREAATNMIRHSGAASCDIILTVDKRAAKLEICDDGRGRTREDRHGAGTARVGVGLIGLTERVEAAGGTLTAANRSGRGFAVTASIPHIVDPACVEDIPDLGRLDASLPAQTAVIQEGSAGEPVWTAGEPAERAAEPATAGEPAERAESAR